MELLLFNSSYGAIIDVVALSVIVLFAFLGFKNGFIKTFLKVFGTIISLVLAILLCSKCAGFLENQFGMISSITEKVSNTVTNIFGEQIANTTLNQAVDSKLSELGLSGWFSKIILEAKADINIPLDTTLNQIISPALSYYIACGISIIFLFIIFKLMFFIIGDITSKISAFNLVGATNKILGVALGLLQSVVTIQFALIVINLIPLEFAQNLLIEISNSSIVRFIDNVNLFELLIKAISKVDILSFVKGTL
ncbi:MAG: CvpA family protein [Clostridia bacterium]|nr:CvpA family protein [Clostridia bacterium]